jgi:ADP-dependent NAD(P)H-hydrate dehydratase
MEPIRLDEQALRAWPLPEVPEDADKESRGRILVIGGSAEIAGAAMLSALAALRVGAGKLAIATAAPVAPGMALAVPEARVIGLPETARCGLHLDGIEKIREVASRADAVVVGPGLEDEESTCAFVAALLPLVERAAVVLDAMAMNVLQRTGPLRQPVLLTPHAGEMAHLTGASKREADSQGFALEAARRWNALVALKNSTTFLAAPDGRLWRHDGGNKGLATSGSGDVLAGTIGGLAARGVPLEQAGGWGVTLHGLAGAALAERHGPLGYLARELPGELPSLLVRVTP